MPMLGPLSKHLFKFLPEQIGKEYIRKIYWKRRIGIIQTYLTKGDEQVFIVLDNGLKFTGDRSILGMLYDQAVRNIYGKHFSVTNESVIVDAGAHQGTFSILMANSAKNGCIVAIEPIERNLLFLKHNLIINEATNVSVIPNGLWSSLKLKTFYLNDSSAAHSAFAEDKVTHSLSVEVDTLDSILEKNKIKKVDFIKMNIEGAEIEALKGARKTLTANPVELAIDAHHVVNGKPTYAIVIPILQEFGFQCEGKELIYAFPKK
jgi:FkbM family methyltransferase